MSAKIIIKEYRDWTKLDKSDAFLDGIDLSCPEINFGIHTYNGGLYTSGYVGIGRIYDKNLHSIQTNGKEHIIVIRPKFNVEPWLMLEKVMTDTEYNDYLKELQGNSEKHKKYLYRIFYDQPVVQLEQNQDNSSDILFALSYINSCYSLCKNGIKKTMFYKEENYNAKIRGKIDLKNNIRFNTSRGRNDKFYCKYIDFTSDNIENRIIKATLIKCKKILEQKFKKETEIIKRTYYCINTLKNVKLVKIKERDFNNVSVSGLYTYYKPLLYQAKYILRQKYHSYKTKDGKNITKSVFSIPYMINMEAVFEFYARIVIKEYFKKTESKYVVDEYSKKLFLEKGVMSESDAKKNIHLIPYCIPDIIIRDSQTNKVVAVLDAKYKDDKRTSRPDTHQLLSYAALTGADKCGFIFPSQTTQIKHLGTDDFIELQTPLINKLKYCEILLGTDLDGGVTS